MPSPGEHKTLQARILKYAQEIGWIYVPRAEAERRRGFDPAGATPEERSRTASLYFGDLLHAQIRAFNPKYKEAEGALIGEFQRFHADIYGNRDFLQALRNQHKFFCAEENRELDLTLIDYGDLYRPRGEWQNVYEVTEEFYTHNGKYGTREDVVFLINGIPVEAIECKNASKDEAIALGVDQIRRYHAETPQVMVPQMLFTATEAIGFAYGVTWNTLRRNLFNWKQEQVGNLEAKVKSFCAVPQLLRILKDFILFAEKEEELQKVILRQHQTGAVDKVVARALDPRRTRGLVWHTQGSGKTYTMIKAAELLFKAPEAEKPTILLMIDRNELEDQMLKNLASVGLGNVAHASSIAELNRLLKQKGQDYRGIVVTMIHKFRDMPANLNLRRNIFVLIDEAHRTTGGDLGNFLMAGLPNASFLGFTGTPVDKTAYGKGTFKTFGCEDDRGYLHKYSIAESIADGTTLPLYYNLAPNEMLVPHEVMEKEFFALAETEGIADIDELNKILERAVNLKNFLKGKDRVNKVAGHVADYDPAEEASQMFFATVQNKIHWAAHGHTAADIVNDRADAARPNMGLTNWQGGQPTKGEAVIAKNYLTKEELEVLNRIVTAYLEFAELQALNRKPMTMRDWIAKLDDFLRMGDQDILTHAGTISHEQALRSAELEFEKFRVLQLAQPSPVEKDFEAAVKKLPSPRNQGKPTDAHRR